MVRKARRNASSEIILQVSAGARKYANQTYLIKLVEAALATTTVPIALHLDHGADFEICKACIDGGFSSVMIDGSRFPFEENVAVTKKVVEYAHERGVSVEAELGKLAGVEDDVLNLGSSLSHKPDILSGQHVMMVLPFSKSSFTCPNPFRIASDVLHIVLKILSPFFLCSMRPYLS